MNHAGWRATSWQRRKPLPNPVEKLPLLLLLLAFSGVKTLDYTYKECIAAVRGFAGAFAAPATYKVPGPDKKKSKNRRNSSRLC
jgi:hypothetical protein